MEYFGLKLQTLRKKAGMSQEDLANLLGVSRQAISKWERSEALPDLYNAKKIAEVFNITLDDLMDIEIKSIDKEKEKNNKLALAFLTVPGVLSGFGVLVVLFAFIGINSLRSLNLFSIIRPVVIFFGLLYNYSLYNLYIGRNTQKFKYMILSLNFLLLLGYIVMLFNIVDYNQVPLIILLILILAIIVLGLIGGFMYNTDYSVNKTEYYVKQTNIFRKGIKIISLIVGAYYVILMGYLLLTHSISQRVGVTYVVDLTNQTGTCDIDISFRENNFAQLFMFCGDDSDNEDNIERIVIYIDDELIHDSNDVTNLNFTSEMDNAIMYNFNYPFEDIDDLDYFLDIAITITTAEGEETLEGYIVHRSDDFNTVVVPIWVTGDH